MQEIAVIGIVILVIIGAFSLSWILGLISIFGLIALMSAE